MVHLTLRLLTVALTILVETGAVRIDGAASLSNSKHDLETAAVRNDGAASLSKPKHDLESPSSSSSLAAIQKVESDQRTNSSTPTHQELCEAMNGAELAHGAMCFKEKHWIMAALTRQKCELESVDAGYDLHIMCEKSGYEWYSGNDAYSIHIGGLKDGYITGPGHVNHFTFDAAKGEVRVLFNQKAGFAGGFRRSYFVYFCDGSYKKVWQVRALGGLTRDPSLVWTSKVGC